MSELETTSIVGARLKKTREAQGLSVEEIATRTRIHRNIIEDMEEDRLSARFNELYVKSFLKRYCEFLGLDSKEIVQEYFSVHQAAPKEPKLRIGVQKLTASGLEKLSITVKILGIAVFGIVFTYYVYSFGIRTFKKQINRFNQRRVEHKALVIKKEAAKEKTKPKPAAKKEEVIAQDSSPTFPIPKNETLTLNITANQSCWMQIKSDSKVVFQGILTPGTSEKWEAQDSLELWLGNAGGIDASINGKKLSALGASGQVVKGLKITHKGIKK